jgi:SAM-dependent methyltransferase
MTITVQKDGPVTQTFYDKLAPFYKLMYADWEGSVQRQAAALHGVIRELIGSDRRRVLDAACGIGTQSIGLARLGYRLTATDISAPAVERARAEAEQHGLAISFAVADMRRLAGTVQGPFDVVIACDNAVPHLLTETDILLAFEQFYQLTASGGGCLISVRDYAEFERGGRRLYPRLAHDIPGGKLLTFDLWEFDGEDYYELTTYLVEDRGQATAQSTVIRGGRYYCVPIATLEELMAQAGFRRVQALRDRFFQPLILGLKR